MNRDVDHPWLRPLWRRVALVAFAAIWAAYEFASGASGWGMMFGALAAYGAWIYLIAYEPGPLESYDQDEGKE